MTFLVVRHNRNSQHLRFDDSEVSLFLIFVIVYEIKTRTPFASRFPNDVMAHADHRWALAGPAARAAEPPAAAVVLVLLISAFEDHSSTVAQREKQRGFRIHHCQRKAG